jgi:hypothetical protein
MLGAAAGLILHQCADPERLLMRAGQHLGFQRRVGFTERGMGQAVKEYAIGEGMLAAAETLKVAPNIVKQLGIGECVVIAQGRAQQIAVSQVRLPESVSELHARTTPAAIVEIDTTTRQEQRRQVLHPNASLLNGLSADSVGGVSDSAEHPPPTPASPNDSIREY